MCIDCAKKLGYVPVPWPVGVWIEPCEMCGRDAATADLGHDFYPPGTPKDVIERKYNEWNTGKK